MAKKSRETCMPQRLPQTGVAFVIAARNEEGTVARVVEACREAAALLARPCEVIVVSDGSEDGTEEVAAAAGARVIARQDDGGSKARALLSGIEASTGEVLFFVDADLVGLRGWHLASIAKPVLEGRATMAVGTFDYRFVARLVQRIPWSTGERAFRRELLDVNDPRLHRYNIELLINEAVGRADGITVSMVMRGVRQLSKLDKLGNTAGRAANFAMWCEIARSVESVDYRAYRSYSRNVMLLDANASALRHQNPLFTGFFHSGLRLTSDLLRKFSASK